MYEYIRGILAASHDEHVVVEAGGMGYRVYVPKNILSQLPSLGCEIKLQLSVITRETGQTLFGFLDAQQRRVFETLLLVSGVGPKIALSVVGCLSTDELRQALLTQDVSAFCRIPGVGKKSAERLIVELKNKVLKLLDTVEGPQGLPHISSPSHPQVRDALCALSNLGYPQATAERALRKIMKEAVEPLDLPTLITLALKQI